MPIKVLPPSSIATFITALKQDTTGKAPEADEVGYTDSSENGGGEDSTSGGTGLLDHRPHKGYPSGPHDINRRREPRRQETPKPDTREIDRLLKEILAAKVEVRKSGVVTGEKDGALAVVDTLWNMLDETLCQTDDTFKINSAYVLLKCYEKTTSETVKKKAFNKLIVLLSNKFSLDVNKAASKSITTIYNLPNVLVEHRETIRDNYLTQAGYE